MRNPICCVIPPHMLDAIVQNGTKAQREAALATQAADATFRSMRASTAKQSAPVTGAVTTPRRTIRSARNQQTTDGPVVRVEGDKPSGNVAADEAYDGLGATFNFFSQVFGRNSIDDDGFPLNATVNFGRRYGNAFWDGRQMVFGDGDGQIFNRFTASLDVVAHELGHGVTEDEAGLVYSNQSGALNESMSDVFGSLVKQYLLKQTAERANWIIGEGLFTPQINGLGLRSMAKPGSAYNDPLLGRDPQPAHMRNYNPTFSDNGGVHINSGIPNHAFYQAAIRFGGSSWTKAGRIWYEALRDPRLRRTSSFVRFAQITLDVALRLKFDSRIVRSSWAAVGITV